MILALHMSVPEEDRHDMGAWSCRGLYGQEILSSGDLGSRCHVHQELRLDVPREDAAVEIVRMGIIVKQTYQVSRRQTKDMKSCKKILLSRLLG